MIGQILSRIRKLFVPKAYISEAALRVDEMSWAFDLVSEAMRPFLDAPDKLDGAGMQEARKALEPLRDTFDRLDEYQRSGLWLKDFEADEAGLLPDGISRSVLSEDGLYNLLEDFRIFAETNIESDD